MTYKEAYKYGADRLKQEDIEEYMLDSRLLLEFACQSDINTLYLHPDRELTEDEYNSYVNLIERRKKHEPLQHLTATQCFMGLDFFVSDKVLIPRPDTECLVEEVLRDLHSGFRILDMCTGSGCILLSLLSLSCDTTGIGADLSNDALEVARINSQKLSMTSRAEFIQSDLFENIEGCFDVIVSNPPYIKTADIAGLMPEVKDHDPFIALDGMEDGLFFYRRIIEKAENFLVRGGLLAFEIGCDQGSEVSQMMKDAGYKEVKVTKDLCGMDRVVTGYRSLL